MTRKVYAGIDIGATNIKYGLVSERGEPLFRNQTPTPQEPSADRLFEKVRYAGEQLLVEADEQNMDVGYIGVGSPGSVNIKTGIIQGTCPNLPFWVGFHLRDRLSDQLNLPVMVDNDANCAALAEYHFGAGRGYQNIICLTIGTGIGGGLIFDGRLYHGADYSAGEVGHMLIANQSRRPGEEVVHLEKIVSAPAIIEELRQRLADEMTPQIQAVIGDDLSQLTIRRMFAAMKKGDRVAPVVVREKAEILGTALAGLANVINPELIVLGGGVAEGGTAFVDIVRKTVRERALPVVAEALAVSPAQLGNSAGFIGAAILGCGEEISAD
jgi:glucokinase